MIKRFSRRRENQPDNHATFSLSFFFLPRLRGEREREKVSPFGRFERSLKVSFRCTISCVEIQRTKRKEKRNGRNAKGVHYFGRGDGETLEEIIERDVEFRDVAVDRAARPRYISR